jgi:hypothetical protein
VGPLAAFGMAAGSWSHRAQSNRELCISSDSFEVKSFVLYLKNKNKNPKFAIRHLSSVAIHE